MQGELFLKKVPPAPLQKTDKKYFWYRRKNNLDFKKALF